MRDCPNFSVDHSVNLSTDHFQPIECVQLYDQFQIFDGMAQKNGTEWARFQIVQHHHSHILGYSKDFALSVNPFFINVKKNTSVECSLKCDFKIVCIHSYTIQT